MLIGGLQKFSLLDYPGRIAAIIFTKGCNFRCQFCYNPMLVQPERHGKTKYARAKFERQKGHLTVKQDDLFAFLEKRAGKLEAVVITGGEPTLHKDLPEFIGKIKKLGYLVKLDTNGTNPEMLKELIKQNLLDYIAMDIKAPREKYEKVAGAKADFNKIAKSVKIIIDSSLPYEFRTTVVPGLLNENDIVKIAKIIKGANILYLQSFKSDMELVNKKLQGGAAYSQKELKTMCQAAKKYVKKCEVR